MPFSMPAPIGTAFADRAPRYDLVVVGAGIVGLGHAYEGHRRGLRVAVVDRSAAIVGASIRNFGHIGVTGQSGQALEFAQVARKRWQRLSVEADLWLGEAGAIVVARGGRWSLRTLQVWAGHNRADHHLDRQESCFPDLRLHTRCLLHPLLVDFTRRKLG